MHLLSPSLQSFSLDQAAARSAESQASQLPSSSSGKISRCEGLANDDINYEETSRESEKTNTGARTDCPGTLKETARVQRKREKLKKRKNKIYKGLTECPNDSKTHLDYG